MVALDALAFDADQPQLFWQQAEAFAKFAQSAFVAERLNSELRALADDPFYTGAWSTNQLTLYRSPQLDVAISLFTASKKFLHTRAYYALYAPVGQAPLRANVYRLPAAYQNEIFDPSLRLESAGQSVTAPGEVLALRTDQFIYDFVIEQPQLVLKMTTVPVRQFDWLFEKDSLKALNINDASLMSTRLRVLSSVLAQIGDPSSIEPVKGLTQHTNPMVRWDAIKALAKLDPEAALECLARASEDPHPQVRTAAIKSLAATGRS